MDTQTLPPPQINGHQNQVNYQQINNFTGSFFTINGRPATPEDTHSILLGRAESAERELEAHKATIQAQQEQIYLQKQIMKELRAEIAKLQDNIDKIMVCNESLNQLIASGVRRRGEALPLRPRHQEDHQPQQ